MPPKTQQWTVVCDFDGTISTVDATDRILETYADPEWLDVEAEWKNGDIGSRECLSRQVALLRTGVAQIDELADTITIDQHFKSFANYCEKKGVQLIIVSDGLDRVIARILDRHELGHLPIYANSLMTTAPRVHRLASPHQDANCCSKAGTCKCAVVSDLIDDDVAGPSILFVGDGQSDYCAAARMADVVAAKSKLLTHMRAIGRDCVPFTTFADVQQLLAKLIDASHAQTTTPVEMIHECN
jgi:2-hydroxy-3-keto-5-methylthiopentenyl-1-phosphate phosphatase